MQKKMIRFPQAFILLLVLLLSQTIYSQRKYKITTDPSNAKRKIIELQPIVTKVNFVEEKRNALDAPHFARKPIVFQPFEMKNPKTGRMLNPDAVMTLKLPDGTQRKTTIKQFYDQVNKLESAMAAKGRSLRDPSSFKDLKPQFVRDKYNTTPKLASGFNSAFKVKPERKRNADGSYAFIPLVMTKAEDKPILFNIITWHSDLFLGDKLSGNGEFPVRWLKMNENGGGSQGKKWALSIQVPKGIDKVIKHIEYQVSDVPFDETIKDIAVPGVKKFVSFVPTWYNYPGIGANVPNLDKNQYCNFTVDFADFENGTVPEGYYKLYYIRTICRGSSNEVLDISPQVIAKYGHTATKIRVPVPALSNSVPGFNYQYPEAGSSIPFGVFLKGSGLHSTKSRDYKFPIESGNDELMTTGYKVTANAQLGLNYFNFLSLIDDNEPSSKPLVLVDGDFKAVVGKVKAQNGGNEDMGVNMTLSFLDGTIKEPISLSEPVPGMANTISLEYDVTEKIDMPILDSRFFIGPVPIRIKAGITGSTGLKMFGWVNTSTYEISGGITPFLQTQFDASGGVDAVIAYATLNAEVNPLLSLNMPMTFNSNGDNPVGFSTNISALAGRIYLKVGFYYPCPSLEKIVGWLTGEEDVPFCQCDWEYNIFDFPGITHNVSY